MRLKTRARRVNHSLHGIYNKIDANMLQSYAWGEAVMQFRKWMRPNWNRWYGAKFGRTLWNEGMRGWQKGAAISMWELFMKPLTEYRKLDKTSRKATSLLNAFVRYWGNIGMMYRSLDAIDKRNIRRFTYNFTAFLTAVVAAALTGSGLDDWKKQSKLNEIMYGFIMYQSSAMTMELSEFAPIFGWKSVLDRFVDSPVPMFKTVADVTELLRYATGELGASIGIPYESDYQSGPKKGWNKFNSQLLSLLPGIREVYNLLTIASIVDFYKEYDNTGVLNFYEKISKASREKSNIK